MSKIRLIKNDHSSDKWVKRAKFTSIKQYKAFKTYLELIDCSTREDFDGYNFLSIVGNTRNPQSWGLTQEEYEAVLEFNKIYG